MSRNPAGTMAVQTSNQAYYRQVSQEVTLDNAVVLYNDEHPRVPACNFASEVLIEELGATAEQVFDQVGGFFVHRDIVCHRWRPALQQPPETLERFLTPRGFVREESLALLRPPDPPGQVDPRVRMLPARAMRRACAAILSERFAGGAENADELVDVQMSRTDDPQYDAFVAMLDDRPAGFVAVHQVGEIGRIRDLFVVRSRRRMGIAASMMNYAIATAQRWLLRPVCVEVPAENVAARRLFERLGFEEAGVLVGFRAPQTAAESIL